MKTFDSSKYWDNRYIAGKDSGEGSYGKMAKFKAKITNDFIKEHHIDSILDLGCGDGNQASLFKCRKYTGFDVSEAIIEACATKFKNDSTKYFTNCLRNLKPADLVLSYEVLFHLIDFDVFMEHLRRLFKFSKEYVIIFSSNEYSRIPQAYHVKHRKFTTIIPDYFPEWKLVKIILNEYPDESFSDFFIYKKIH